MPLGDVGAPSLNEVPRKSVAKTFARRARDLRQPLEVRREQAEQPVEGGVIATMRSRREQDEVPRCGAGQTLEQFVPLMPAPPGRGAGVCLVNDHEVRARLQEVVSPLAGLHVVETDDRVPVLREDAHARRYAALQTARASGGDRCGTDMEAYLQLGDPLVHEVRRTEDDGTVDVAAVEKLAGYKQSLDRLAHPDVVRDEEAHRIELERHEQRHKLVGAWLNRDLSKAPKRSGTPSQRQQQRVAKQEGRVVPAELLRTRQGEPGLANRLHLQRQVDQRPILIRTRDRTDPQRRRRASGEDDPLPPARADEASRRVDEVAHGACPRAEASRAKVAFQPEGSSN